MENNVLTMLMPTYESVLDTIMRVTLAICDAYKIGEQSQAA
jgi:hypothetical protein